MSSPSEANTTDVERAVRAVLGRETLHDWQRIAVDAALRGDTLAVVRSGAGKSAVYQVAARVLGGLTVVVSPTVSLQRDQLAAWHRRFGGGAVLNATRGRRREREVLDAARSGRLALLLLAPEQLGRAPVIEALAGSDVRLLVVDEAHCVSEWGHDFRPDYLHLAAARRRLGAPRVLALTATASRQLREDVVARLELDRPAVIVAGLDRPNIWLGATVRSSEAERDATVVGTALDVDGPALVYAQTRAATERLAALFQEAGRQPAVYHAGLPAKERDATADAFLGGRLDLVVATSAFGMGVDRPDVRGVVHAGPSPSLDAYYQEVGRAGRDDEPARAVLVHRAEDFALGRYLRSGGGPQPATLRAVISAVQAAGTDGATRPDLARAAGFTARTVAGALGPLLQLGAVDELTDDAEARLVWSPGHDPAEVLTRLAEDRERRRRLDRSRVEMVQSYAGTDDCRRRLILELLGEHHPEECGACDNCDAGTSRPAQEAQYVVGQRVRHTEFGTGAVSHVEVDRVTVLFDSVGYRTLAIQLIEEGGLLV